MKSHASKSLSMKIKHVKLNSIPRIVEQELKLLIANNDFKIHRRFGLFLKILCLCTINGVQLISPQRDDRGGWKENICLWPARKYPSRTDFARHFGAFHRVCLPSIRGYSSTICFRNVYTPAYTRARKCFVTIVAVNCTCQPDIIDPARGEQLRTWVEGTWSEASATRDK